MSPRTIDVFLTLVFGLAPALEAQRSAPPEPPPAVELWGGFSGPLAAAGGTIESTYAPALATGTIVESSATQTLAVDTAFGSGFEVGANLFASRRAGLQLFLARTGANVRGTNGPYAVHLRYVSRPPPDNVPREVVYSSEEAWPDTTGVLRELAVGAGAVVRLGGGGAGVAGTLAAGVSFSRYSGEIDRLGFTDFRLGGHSVLFGFEYPVVVGPRARWSPAPYVSGQLDLGGDRRAAFTIGLRVDPRGARDVAIHVIRLANAADAAVAPPVSEIQRQLAPPPLHLGRARWQIVLGLKVRPSSPGRHRKGP
jgi:hypothetical protein